jgi:hypothetical protein
MGARQQEIGENVRHHRLVLPREPVRHCQVSRENQNCDAKAANDSRKNALHDRDSRVLAVRIVVTKVTPNINWRKIAIELKMPRQDFEWNGLVATT